MLLLIGVKRQISSASSAWTRIGESEGLVANACLGTGSDVINDFDSIYPWSDIISYNYNTSTDKITAYYGDINFRYDGSNGEVLTYIPEFYYKRFQEDGWEYIYISKYAKTGYLKSEEFSVGRYLTSEDAEGNLKVASNKNVSTGKKINEYRGLIKSSLGDEFCMYDTRHFTLQALYLVEYADYDSQKVLGNGNTNYMASTTILNGATIPNSYALYDSAGQDGKNTIIIPISNGTEFNHIGMEIYVSTGYLEPYDEIPRTVKSFEPYYENGTLAGYKVVFDGPAVNLFAGVHGLQPAPQSTGGCDALGMKSGYIGANGYSSVSYRGIEDIFGNAYVFLDGINIKNNRPYICTNPELYASDVFSGAYAELSYTSDTSGVEYNAVTLGCDEKFPLIAVPNITRPNSTSIPDSAFGTATGNSIIQVNGTINSYSAAGLFNTIHLGSSDLSSNYSTCRIIRYK